MLKAVWKNGVAAMTLPVGWCWPLGVVLGIAAGGAWGLALGLGMVILRRRGRWVVLAAGLAAGCLALAASRWYAADHILRQLRGHDGAVRLTVTVDDANCTGGVIPFAGPSRLIQAEIVRGEWLGGTAAPERWRGRVYLRFGEKVAFPAKLRSGMSLEIEGALRLPASALAPRFYTVGADGAIGRDYRRGGGFDNYLAAQGLAVTCTVRRWRELPAAVTWRYKLLEYRDRLLARTVSCLDSAEDRAVTAALVFGVRSGLSQELKRQYIQSGVIHIFSVSGLHVGVLAGILWLIFRPVPFRWRNLLVVLLAFYVLMTGGEAPAVRAFLMICAVALARSKLLYLRPEEVLAQVAAGLLLYNPAFLADAGFQYSFVVTGFLILGAPRARELGATVMARLTLLPVRAAGRRRLQMTARVLARVLQATFFATVAATAAGALSLYHQGNFFPGTILLNLLLLPLVSLAFALTGILTLLPVAGALQMWNLGLMRQVVTATTDFTAGSGYLVPGAWSVGVLLALLAIYLTARRRVWIYGALCGTAAWLIWREVGRWWLPPLVAVIAGGSAEWPTLVLTRPASASAVVVDPGRGRAELIREFCDRQGIRSIDAVILTANRRGNAADLSRLFNHFDVRLLITVYPEIRSKSLQSDLAALRGLFRRSGVSGADGGAEYGDGARRVTVGRAGYVVVENGFPERTVEVRFGAPLIWRVGAVTVKQEIGLAPTVYCYGETVEEGKLPTFADSCSAKK